MKLLLFSDLHNSRAAAERLAALADSVDVLVGAGDFANVRRGLPITIDVLARTGGTAVLVPGNSESVEELRAACAGWEKAHVLHGDAVTLQGVTFFGLGGGIPVTPFGSWSYDFTEQEAEGLLANAPASCDVLVSHSPPFGAVDVSSGGRRLGSTSVRGFIERVQPRLVVCGHIHGSAGQEERVGETAVVNAGPGGLIYNLERLQQ